MSDLGKEYRKELAEKDAEIERLTAEKGKWITKAAIKTADLIKADERNLSLQSRVEALEALYLRDAGSCDPLHLAAALGNRPCTICGEDTWVKAAAEPGESDE